MVAHTPGFTDIFCLWPPPLSLRRRFILHNTARILTASFRVHAYLSRIFPEKRIEHVDIPVDGEEFRPAPKSEKLRLEFGTID
jgi:hypothetical protein